VLHVSQLKKALTPATPLSTDDDLQLLLVLDTLPPSQVLAHRFQTIGNRLVPSMLVQQEPCPSHWATWQPAATISALLSSKPVIISSILRGLTIA
jgi:hypothetical protein